MYQTSEPEANRFLSSLAAVGGNLKMHKYPQPGIEYDTNYLVRNHRKALTRGSTFKYSIAKFQ